jgi:hypothetical protein
LAAGQLVDGIQVKKVRRISQSKSGNIWIENTVCTLATLGAHSPTVLHCLPYYTHQAQVSNRMDLGYLLHSEPTHLLYYTICTGYT